MCIISIKTYGGTEIPNMSDHDTNMFAPPPTHQSYPLSGKVMNHVQLPFPRSCAPHERSLSPWRRISSPRRKSNLRQRPPHIVCAVNSSDHATEPCGVLLARLQPRAPWGSLCQLVPLPNQPRTPQQYHSAQARVCFGSSRRRSRYTQPTPANPPEQFKVLSKTPVSSPGPDALFSS